MHTVNYTNGTNTPVIIKWGNVATIVEPKQSFTFETKDGIYYQKFIGFTGFRKINVLKIRIA